MKIETSLRKQLIPMSKTIAQLAGGTGKGDIAELRITEALRQLYHQDEFDTTSAPKGGSDSIAKVCDKKIEVGKITISVKNTKKWNSEFKTQIEKNMEQDSTKFGILVSETLPKTTNETGEVVHSSNGGMYFLVHPKYATALSTLKDPTLKPIDQNTMIFYNRVSVFKDFGGLGFEEESIKMANALGNKQHMLLANHGIITTGETVADGFNSLYYFEKAAETYLTALSTNKELKIVSHEVAEKTAEETANYPINLAKLYLNQIKLILDKEEPEYKN